MSLRGIVGRRVGLNTHTHTHAHTCTHTHTSYSSSQTHTQSFTAHKESFSRYLKSPPASAQTHRTHAHTHTLSRTHRFRNVGKRLMQPVRSPPPAERLKLSIHSVSSSPIGSRGKVAAGGDESDVSGAFVEDGRGEEGRRGRREAAYGHRGALQPPPVIMTL